MPDNNQDNDLKNLSMDDLTNLSVEEIKQLYSDIISFPDNIKIASDSLNMPHEGGAFNPGGCLNPGK